jgi:peptidyl-prolyl cis-trans isomerase C
MSKITALIAVALAAATAVAAPTSALPPNTPLVADGRVVIDSTDFEGNMLRIPEEKRSDFRVSGQRVSEVIHQMFVARSFAQRARDAGLDRDPAVQARLRQVQDGVLAELYREKVEREAVVGNLEQRARELYTVDKAKFVTKEEVYIQHILVNTKGRTRETAAERARQAAADARGNPDFLAVAVRWSDDDDKTRNGGDLGFNSPTSFTEPVRKAIAGMKKGEVAGPVESEFGFHIIKLVDRKAAEPIPFEAVSKRLIEAEREKVKKLRLEAVQREILDAPTVVVYQDNVKKLVVPVSPEALKRATEDKAAAK